MGKSGPRRGRHEGDNRAASPLYRSAKRNLYIPQAHGVNPPVICDGHLSLF